MGNKKLLASALTRTAKATWPALQFVNKVLGDGKTTQPKWAPAPLAKSYQRTKPPLGFPRETDSLCPKCVVEVREAIIRGDLDYTVLIDSNPAQIKAKLVERGNEVWMVKECQKHGKVEDIISIDSKFLKRIESLFPGRDFKSPKCGVRNHGASTVQYGRGSVLTVDLTNRCNMMCEPCFMDANQVGYVHELSMDDVKKILDNSVTIKPRRQLSVQFSGGEPSLSPHFIDAIKYAKEVGYFSVQCATNGIHFASDPEFCKKAADAGLRIAYLQFDGVGNMNNEHRKIGNLFDVKLRAIENLYNAGIDVVLVVTIVNTLNDHQVGPIVKFAIENADKISFIAFQPVSFTGRDEGISDEDRFRQRYTLSHLAYDVKHQAGVGEPLRDWFPLSVGSIFANLGDFLGGAAESWGSMNCGCHPTCGAGTAIMVNKRTKEHAPLMQFFNFEQFLKDVDRIADAARGNKLTKLQLSSALLRNIDVSKFPKGLTLKDFLTKFDKQSGGALEGKEYGNGGERKKDKWLILFVAGMWFQDLFNYDFRRTEMCVIPYGTQLGEISFCAYNTGMGWRNIVEHVCKNGSTADWYKEHGRHAIYAGGQDLELPSFENTLTVTDEMIVEKPSKIRDVKDTELAATGTDGKI